MATSDFEEEIHELWSQFVPMQQIADKFGVSFGSVQHLARVRGWERSLPERQCMVCGKTFSPKRANNLCCSKACTYKSIGVRQTKRDRERRELEKVNEQPISDLPKITKDRCKRCKHFYGMDVTNPLCKYILDTGKRRNCPAGYCDKYEARTRKNNVKAMKVKKGE